MARLNADSDDELPDLQDIINEHAKKAWPQSQPLLERRARSSKTANGKLSKDQKHLRQTKGASVISGKDDQSRSKSSRLESNVPRPHPQYRAQSTSLTKNDPTDFASGFTRPSTVRSTPGRSAKKTVQYRSQQLSPLDGSENESSFEDGSKAYSEDDWQQKALLSEEDVFNGTTSARRTPLQDFHPNNAGSHLKRLTRTKPTNCLSSAGIVSRDPSEANTKDSLKRSPPSERSPRKLSLSQSPPTSPSQRPCTPPATKSPQNRLTSPSKQHVTLPQPPHRPSLDSFWNQDVVNEWTEQHSPRKILQSPSKLRFLDSLRDLVSDEDDNTPASPTASPRKSRNRSPKKTDAEKRAAGARKTFESDKHALASSFLEELDQKITGGKIGSMANDGLGVKLEWSRKLNSTAGRAHWKKEGRREKTLQGQEKAEIKYRHEAKIELAEKVIDCEDRLINVIAHEYCHLACFMISGIRDNPHGKEFKAWARKCTTAFAHRNIKVTTKHSYVIDYKYIWACMSCAAEYKRHSKSIDTARHACGYCKAKLVQIKPVPRGAKGPSEYQAFVKKFFADVKQENPGAKHGEIMQIIGRMYRESKADLVKSEKLEENRADTTKLGGLVKELEILVIDDD
ncbi:MAG: hypothetical protein M1821_004276 [Bathelium mastoideum]|nr:MAG: hypothetical protein M1821_004276 [Bathelium mastoideum]